MGRIIEDFKGKKKEIGCIGCAIEKGIVKNDFVIFQTKHFAAEQDFEIPIPGFIILRTRRHITSFEDFNKKEEKGFLPFLIKVRKAMRDVLEIKVVYFHQEEDTSHHFHIWMFPRYDWMKKFGKDIKSVRPIMEHARNHLKTDKNIKEVNKSIEKLKNQLKK